MSNGLGSTLIVHPFGMSDLVMDLTVVAAYAGTTPYLVPLQTLVLNEDRRQAIAYDEEAEKAVGVISGLVDLRFDPVIISATRDGVIQAYNDLQAALLNPKGGTVEYKPDDLAASVPSTYYHYVQSASPQVKDSAGNRWDSAISSQDNVFVLELTVTFRTHPVATALSPVDVLASVTIQNWLGSGDVNYVDIGGVDILGTLPALVRWRINPSQVLGRVIMFSRNEGTLANFVPVLDIGDGTPINSASWATSGGQDGAGLCSPDVGYNGVPQGIQFTLSNPGDMAGRFAVFGIGYAESGSWTHQVKLKVGNIVQAGKADYKATLLACWNLVYAGEFELPITELSDTETDYDEGPYLEWYSTRNWGASNFSLLGIVLVFVSDSNWQPTALDVMCEDEGGVAASGENLLIENLLDSYGAIRELAHVVSDTDDFMRALMIAPRGDFLMLEPGKDHRVFFVQERPGGAVVLDDDFESYKGVRWLPIAEFDSDEDWIVDALSGVLTEDTGHRVEGDQAIMGTSSGLYNVFAAGLQRNFDLSLKGLFSEDDFITLFFEVLSRGTSDDDLVFPFVADEEGWVYTSSGGTGAWETGHLRADGAGYWDYDVLGLSLVAASGDYFLINLLSLTYGKTCKIKIIYTDTTYDYLTQPVSGFAMCVVYDGIGKTVSSFRVECEAGVTITFDDVVIHGFTGLAASSNDEQLVFLGEWSARLMSFGVLATGKHFLAAKKSTASPGVGWDKITSLGIAVLADYDDCNYIWDCLRLEKADPDDDSVPNATGLVWDFQPDSGVWTITEDVADAGATLACLDIEADVEKAALIAATTPDDVRFRARVMAKRDAGVVGIVWRAGGDTLTAGAEDCYAALIDVTAQTLSIVEYAGGTPTVLDSVAFVCSVDAWYVVGITASGSGFDVCAAPLSSLADDDDVFEATAVSASDATLASGQCGVMSIGTLGRFDQVKVVSAQDKFDPSDEITVVAEALFRTIAPFAAEEVPTGLAPIVSEVYPGFGPEAGATSVVISGSGFMGATSVTFDGVPGTGLVVTSSTSITVVSPSGTGIVDVLVTTPNGTSATSEDAEFTYIMADLTFPFASDEEGWVYTSGGGTGSWYSHGYLIMQNAGRWDYDASALGLIALMGAYFEAEIIGAVDNACEMRIYYTDASYDSLVLPQSGYGVEAQCWVSAGNVGKTVSGVRVICPADSDYVAFDDAVLHGFTR